MDRRLRQDNLQTLLPVFLGLAFVFPSSAEAQSNPLAHVQKMMRDADTRFVAVEFYASWCKPCVASVPKWRALQRRYAAHGLKVIVVSTQDKKGGCEDPGWSPDKVVCDEEGTLAEQYGANKLPSAFLWSWDGRLLARNASHGDVAKALKGAVKKSPRVAISVEGPVSRKMQSKLRSLLREQVGASKIRLVASDRQKKRIQQLLKAQHRAKFDEEMQCELGKALPANALLSADVNSGALQLSLVSAESGCVLALGSASWSAARPRSAVRRAMRQLLGRLTRPLVQPNARSTRQIAYRAPPVRAAPEAGEVLVANFRSVPSGADVFFGDKQICAATPCSGIVEAGRHQVTFRRDGFEEKVVTAGFSSDQLVASVKLTPKAGVDMQAVLQEESRKNSAVATEPPTEVRPPRSTTFKPVLTPSGTNRRVVLMPIDPLDHRSTRERIAVDRVIRESLKKLGYRVTVVSNARAEEARIDDFPKDLRCARSCQKLLRKRYPGALLIIPSYRPLRGRTKVLLSLRVTAPDGASHGTMVTPSDDRPRFESAVRTRLYGLIERMGS